MSIGWGSDYKSVEIGEKCPVCGETVMHDSKTGGYLLCCKQCDEKQAASYFDKNGPSVIRIPFKVLTGNGLIETR